MKLGDLARAAPNSNLEGDPDAAVTGLAYDSREVTEGTLFFCVPGHEVDGHDFASAAQEAGAAAVLVERHLGDLNIPQIIVSSVRAAAGPIAAEFNANPSHELDLIGITGTNGKTTTAYLVRSILEARGMSCGLIGTVKRVVGGVEESVTHTTPEAIDLQADLRRMVDAGDSACAAEISSHALSLGRAGGSRVAVAAFTNLTQDHLDFYPGGMDEYFEAKKRLFIGRTEDGDPESRMAVVNVDDGRGSTLAAELRPGLGDRLITVSPGGATADLRADQVAFDAHGARFQLSGDAIAGGPLTVETRLPGAFNVENSLIAIAIALSVGVDPGDAVAALAKAEPVPGRFEPIDAGQEFSVLVDYAHTPDSLENVLSAARELTDSRVISVIGCGGDRDRTKRPLMGDIGARLSDLTVITSDNPRSEDPAAIVEEVAVGARSANGAGQIEIEIDRRVAIEHAVAAAGPGDVVVIAGKGHEQGQEFKNGEKLPFDDRTVAREALEGLA